MKITELSKNERPREKLLELGPTGLSNGELLAVILREGFGELNALDLARLILDESGGTLSGLFGMDAERLCGIYGVGAFKAAAILAALELGKRLVEESSNVSHQPILTARMVFDLMIPRMKPLQHEECWVLFLNTKNYLTGKIKIGEGGIDSTVMDQRRILREALEHGATGVILVHNHPSGNPSPGKADISVTDKLKTALNAVGLQLLDHVVVAAGSFFSFSEGRTMNALD